MYALNPVKSLHGEIEVPGDKSISHRAVLIGSIADGTTEITNFLTGNDCMSTISCFKSMGIDIELFGNRVLVHGWGVRGLTAPNVTLDTGNSGTTTRLLTGLLSAQSFNSVINGDASIRKRPMDRIITPLSLMGADIKSEDGGHCPLRITGKNLHGIEYALPVASAQLKSALILAGLYAEGETIIHEPIPSRNHTELMLSAFGANIKSANSGIYVTKASSLSSCAINVPGDISSAAFFLVAGSIVPNSEITLKNVGINDTRSGIITVLLKMGANIKIEPVMNSTEPTANITVKSAALKGTEVSGELIPLLIDEIPAIAVAAAYAAGTTIISGASELKHKETNRINTVTNELKKANVDITETDDGFIINGGRPVLGCNFNSHGDHRIAMAMVVCSLSAIGCSTLEDESAADVSYPDFYSDLNMLSMR